VNGIDDPNGTAMSAYKPTQSASRWRGGIVGTTPDEQYDADDKESAQVTRPDAIRLDPGSAVYHNDLGRALYDQERFAEAEEAQREAVRLNPEHPVFLFNVGTDLHAQGRYEEDEAAYRKAIQLDRFYDVLGAALSGQDKDVEAERACPCARPGRQCPRALCRWS
jgi:tetratricopeptide (TPR) repeat protein